MLYEANGVLPPKQEDNSLVTNIANSANPPCQESNETLEFNFIPDRVYKQLPKLLQDSANIFQDQRERDIYLTGAINVLGGCFHNVYAYNEMDKTKVSPNLFAFIIAPPASGKGVLKYSKKLIDIIVKTFAQNCHNLTKSKCKLLIPANNSAAGVVKLLEVNSGVGVMIESEIDTLANSQKQEWGKYSDILRHSFENESYSFYRKGKDEYVFLERVSLSLAISGTKEQFKNFMGSPENGLFSRGCYYVFNDSSNILQCYGRLKSEIDIEQQFGNIAELANKYYERLLEFDEVKVHFTGEQLNCIESILQKEYGELFSIKDLQSNIKRAFVIAQKIAVILTILESCLEKVDCRMACTVTALSTAIDLTVTYLKHGYLAYEMLPQNMDGGLSINATRLLDVLPEYFTRGEAVKKAEELIISIRTIDKIIKELAKKGFIINNGYGKFQKVVLS